MTFKYWCEEIGKLVDTIKDLTEVRDENSIGLHWHKLTDDLSDFGNQTREHIYVYNTILGDPRPNYNGELEQEEIFVSTNELIFLPPISRNDLKSQIGIYKRIKIVDPDEELDDYFNLPNIYDNFERMGIDALSTNQKKLLELIKSNYSIIINKFEEFRVNFSQMDEQIQAVNSLQIKEFVPNEILLDFINLCRDCGTISDSIFLLKIEFSPKYDDYIKELTFTKNGLPMDNLQEAWKKYLDDYYGSVESSWISISQTIYKWYIKERKYHQAISICEFLRGRVDKDSYQSLYKDIIDCYKQIGDAKRALFLISQEMDAYKRGVFDLEPGYYEQLCLDENDLQVSLSKIPQSEREINLRKHLEESKSETQKLGAKNKELDEQIKVAMPLSELKAFREKTSPEQFKIQEQGTKSEYKGIWALLSEKSKEQLILSRIFLSINFTRHVVQTMALALEIELYEKIRLLLNDPAKKCTTLGDIIHLIYDNQIFLKTKGRYFNTRHNREDSVKDLLYEINEQRRKAVHAGEYPEPLYQAFKYKIIDSGFYKNLLSAIVRINPK